MDLNDANEVNPDDVVTRCGAEDQAINSDDRNAEMAEKENAQLVRKNAITVFSCIYGILLTTVGAIIYINFDNTDTIHVCEVFSTIIALVGLLWLLFLSIDIYLNQNKTLTEGRTSLLSSETVSTPSYLFHNGRHSVSVYLKVGLTAFFAGHLINEGLMLIQEVLDFTQDERIAFGCGSIYSLIHHIARISYSFFQFCIVFKCSNVAGRRTTKVSGPSSRGETKFSNYVIKKIIINRNKALASWALMHILASCLCFWFETILEETLEDFHQQVIPVPPPTNSATYFKENTLQLLFPDPILIINSTFYVCSDTALLSEKNLSALPHLYPFTIEFNILLAGVWFIVWQNIGKYDLAEVERSISHSRNTSHSDIAQTYHSSTTMYADCQAAYKGLFAGMGVIITSVILLIVFFVEMSLGNEDVSYNIHNGNECVLTILALIGVGIGCVKLSKLDYIRHSVYIDDVLMFIPLPFFFIHAAMVVVSELRTQTVERIFMSLLITVQVVLQTPFIITSLRMCSKCEKIGYKKPGKQVITFLTACNLSLWIINTFETKGVESYYGKHMYFSPFLWLFVSHITLPFKLFYRFHSSACLADIWASAYK